MVCYELLNIPHDLSIPPMRLLLHSGKGGGACCGRLGVEDERYSQKALDELDEGIAAVGLLMARRDSQWSFNRDGGSEDCLEGVFNAVSSFVSDEDDINESSYLVVMLDIWS